MQELDKMMKAMQSALELQKKTQQELKDKKVEGSAGGGMVCVVMDGNLKACKVTVEQSVLEKQDAQFLADMICCAVNDAIAKAREIGTSAAKKHLLSSDLLNKLGEK